MNSTWELQNLSKKYEINEGSLAISQWFRWDFASLARRLGHARPMAEDSPKTPSKANSLGSGLGEVSASRCKSFRSATEPSSTTLDKTFWQTVDSVYIYICTNLHHIFLTNFMAQFSYHVFFVHTEKKFTVKSPVQAFVPLLLRRCERAPSCQCNPLRGTGHGPRKTHKTCHWYCWIGGKIWKPVLPWFFDLFLTMKIIGL